MRQFTTLFIVLIILCILISCERDEKIDIVPMHIIDSHIYTTAVQEHFETPHYAVFAIVHCGIHAGYTGNADYKTEYPLETPAMTFAGHPIYNNDDTINVKMAEHRNTDLKAIRDLAGSHVEVVFIGFCTQGKYELNINDFKKEFSVPIITSQ